MATRGEAAGKKRGRPSKRRAGTEGEEERMVDEGRRREGRRQDGREPGLGGSDSGGGGQGGQSWGAHLERTDFACVEGQRGRRRTEGRRQAGGTAGRWLLVVGSGWGENERGAEQDLQEGCLDR